MAFPTDLIPLFLITMSRDIEVIDVRVSLEDGEPVSVGDVADFAVRHTTTLAALKLDAWILPVRCAAGLSRSHAGRTGTRGSVVPSRGGRLSCPLDRHAESEGQESP